MSLPSKDQRVVYQLSMYASLVQKEEGPDLEARLYADILEALEKDAPEIGKWSVAWGPVVVQSVGWWPPTLERELPYAANAMYVAESQDEEHLGTYVVGVAGTNPSSLYDWVVEDGLVWKQVPWVYGLRSAPDAKIALGTAIGLHILQNAVPGRGRPGAGTSLLEFLQGIARPGTNVIVSGHSLGGALSPTLTLWLQDIRTLWDPDNQVTLSTMPTAGPTAGNADFAAYSNQTITATRFANALDVVPHAWQLSDLARVPRLYAPHIEPDEQIKKAVALAMYLAKGGEYTQIVDDTGWFPFVVNTHKIDPTRSVFQNFLAQLAWQHTVAYMDWFHISSKGLREWAERFQEAVVEAAPAVEAALAAHAAGKESAIDADALAARVVTELLRHATPEQRQIALPVDPHSLVEARSPAP